MTDENIPKLEIMLREDAKLLMHHAIDNGVPMEWYFHHLQGHVFRQTEQICSDMDFLLSKGPEATRFYTARIKEDSRRIPIFGKEQYKNAQEAIDEVLSLVNKGMCHCPERSNCLHVLHLAGSIEGREELRNAEE